MTFWYRLLIVQSSLCLAKGYEIKKMTKPHRMTRLSSAFPANRAALIAFVTAGDPTVADTPAILDALVEGGADIIELGMPFTDPMADGPAIQAGNIRSLASGTKTADILRIAARISRSAIQNVPLVLMGYANTIDDRPGDADGCCDGMR